MAGECYTLRRSAEGRTAASSDSVATSLYCQRVRNGAAFGRAAGKLNDVFGKSHPLRAILSSLGAFLAATARPRTPLARAIVLVLAVKLIGIVAIKVVMFPDNARPSVNAAAMARVIGPDAIAPLISSQ